MDEILKKIEHLSGLKVTEEEVVHKGGLILTNYKVSKYRCTKTQYNMSNILRYTDIKQVLPTVRLFKSLWKTVERDPQFQKLREVPANDQIKFYLKKETSTTYLLYCEVEGKVVSTLRLSKVTEESLKKGMPEGYRTRLHIVYWIRECVTFFFKDLSAIPIHI